MSLSRIFNIAVNGASEADISQPSSAWAAQTNLYL